MGRAAYVCSAAHRHDEYSAAHRQDICLCALEHRNSAGARLRLLPAAGMCTCITCRMWRIWNKGGGRVQCMATGAVLKGCGCAS
jgi:hypothetical protein